MGVLKSENSVFLFDSYRVDIKEERTVSYNRNVGPIENLRISINNLEPISFAYENGQGLITIKQSKSNRVINVLGELLKIKSTNIDSYEQFLQKNGFLFELEKDKIYNVSPEFISTYACRLMALNELINEVNNACDTDILKIMDLSMYLLFNSGWELQIDEKTYSSYKYELASVIDNAPNIIIETINRQQAINYGKYIIEDSIYKKYELSSDEYNEIVNMTTSKEEWDDFRFASLTYLYANNHYTGLEKEIIDLLYHWFRDVGVPSEFTFEGATYLKRINKNNIDVHNLLDSAILLGKYIISCEINHGIEDIRPICDLATMQPRWVIPSLNSALYFSLFYLDKSKEMYRRCAHCGSYFIVNRSSSTRLYCDKYCRNNAQQANHRLKLKNQNKNDR